MRIFVGDSLLNTRIAASFFAIADVLAIVAIAAGDVIVKPDMYMKIINLDAWKQVRDPENYIKIINQFKYEKLADGVSTIIDSDTYDGVADKDSYTQLFEEDTYKKLVDNDAFRQMTGLRVAVGSRNPFPKATGSWLFSEVPSRFRLAADHSDA